MAILLAGGINAEVEEFSAAPPVGGGAAGIEEAVFSRLHWGLGGDSVGPRSKSLDFHFHGILRLRAGGTSKNTGLGNDKFTLILLCGEPGQYEFVRAGRPGPKPDIAQAG